jgi:hypothetical protein
MEKIKERRGCDFNHKQGIIQSRKGKKRMEGGYPLSTRKTLKLNERKKKKRRM